MIHLKESNQWLIHDLQLANPQTDGNKLHALHRLIQKRGEPLKGKGLPYDGVKAIEYREGQYYAMIHKSYKKGFFFPCSVKHLHLTKL